MRYQKGFTLLEVMLAFTLMVVAVSAVVLSSKSAGPEDEVKKQAFRFKTAMTMAADRALLTGQELGLMVDKNGYQFLVWRDFEWQPLNEKALAPYKLDDDLEMELELSLDGLPWQTETLFESDDGIFENLFADEEEDKKKLVPQVFIYSHGEFTDFNLMFHWRGDEPFTIHAAGLTYKVELMDEEEIDNFEVEE